MTDDSSIFDEMDLPLDNPKASLETISENHFRPLFSPDLFEIRSEEKDKGIDFSLEVKRKGKHTNLRVSIQLKATETLNPNADGTLSLQIHTKNIQYLFNGTNSAYYVLFIKDTEQLYCADLNRFVSELQNTRDGWQRQATHVLRFKNSLDKDQVKLIHDTAIRQGTMQRELRLKLLQSFPDLDNQVKNISIDHNLNVKSDVDIVDKLTKFGLVLINKGRFDDILNLHRRAAVGGDGNARYHLVVGLAYFQKGSLFDSLSQLRKARKRINELDETLISYLDFAEVSVKRSLELISDDDYSTAVREIDQSADAAFNAKLEAIRVRFMNSVGQSPFGDIDRLRAEIQELLADPEITSGPRLMAKCELILADGRDMNTQWDLAIIGLHGSEEAFGVDLNLRKLLAEEFLGTRTKWREDVREIKDEARETANYFAFFSAILQEHLALYEYESSLCFFHAGAPPTPSIRDDDYGRNDRLKSFLERLEEAFDFFDTVGHYWNAFATKALMYQVAKFMNEGKEEQLMHELTNYVASQDYPEVEKKFAFLKDGGAYHEQHSIMVADALKAKHQMSEEKERLTNELVDLDDQEMKKGPLKTDFDYYIDLFPIGRFLMTKGQVDKVMDILKVPPESRQLFKEMFEHGIIPVANILAMSVTREGPGEGYGEYTGHASFLNMHRVRKALYAEGCPREDNCR